MPVANAVRRKRLWQAGLASWREVVVSQWWCVVRRRRNPSPPLSHLPPLPHAFHSYPLSGFCPHPSQTTQLPSHPAVVSGDSGEGGGLSVSSFIHLLLFPFHLFLLFCCVPTGTHLCFSPAVAMPCYRSLSPFLLHFSFLHALHLIIFLPAFALLRYWSHILVLCSPFHYILFHFYFHFSLCLYCHCLLLQYVTTHAWVLRFCMHAGTLVPPWTRATCILVCCLSFAVPCRF